MYTRTDPVTTAAKANSMLMSAKIVPYVSSYFDHIDGGSVCIGIDQHIEVLGGGGDDSGVNQTGVSVHHRHPSRHGAVSKQGLTRFRAMSSFISTY